MTIGLLLIVGGAAAVVLALAVLGTLLLLTRDRGPRDGEGRARGAYQSHGG
jgi:hypothetical protein